MSKQTVSRFRLYLKLELKKYALALPKIGGGLCLVLLLTGAFLLLYQRCFTEYRENGKIQIGIAAEPEEPYLDWMMQMLESMEELQRSCKFESVTESEGMRRLQEGKYTALFLIPHDYIHSLIDGKEAILRIRFAQGQATTAHYLVRELGNAASQIMLDTQAGIYAMQDYYRENGFPDMSKDELSLNIRYLQKVLSRKDIYSYEEIPAAGTLADQTHYFAVGILCFMASLGLVCITILSKEPDTFLLKLQQFGLRNEWRILAKLLAMILCFGCIYLTLSILCAIAGPYIPGWNDILHNTADSVPLSVLQTGFKFLAILPVLTVICTGVLWIFELTWNPVSRTLLLFVSFLCLAYLSGYFYPLSYLPDRIQKLSAWLPTSVILKYCYHILTGNGNAWDLVPLLAYAGFLYGTLVCISYFHLQRRRSK